MELRVIGHSPSATAPAFIVGLAPGRRHAKALVLGKPDARREVLGEQAEVKLPRPARDHRLASLTQRAQKGGAVSYLLRRGLLVEAFDLDPEPIGINGEIGLRKSGTGGGRGKV